MIAHGHKLKVLVTGAYGLIGNLVYARLAAQPELYEAYGMTRRTQPSVRVLADHLYELPVERVRLADLSELTAVEQAVAGMDVVVHLAAEPDGQTGWDSVLQNNVIGTHNLFEASRRAGVQRVVYASTNQVVFGYRADAPYRDLFAERYAALDPATIQPIDYREPTRPLNEYACSKVFGEALAHMYAFTHGLSCLCLRIGWVTPDDQVPHPAGRSLWCSQRDIVQLIERCIQAPPSLRFDVFFGQSHNRYNLVDIQHTCDVLGYAPQDDAEEHV